MLKKLPFFISLIATLLIFTFVSAGSVFAAEQPKTNGSGSTQFKILDSQKNESNNFSSTADPDAGGGWISCMDYSNIAECHWTITATEPIIYSNVKVTLEKWHGWFNGGWKYYASRQTNYEVNGSFTTIRDVAGFSVSPGKYRASLGGTFTTREHVYGATFYQPHVFEVN